MKSKSHSGQGHLRMKRRGQGQKFSDPRPEAMCPIADAPRLAPSESSPIRQHAKMAGIS